jgi:transitional endoplasmic reticulum ATPase
MTSNEDTKKQIIRKEDSMNAFRRAPNRLIVEEATVEDNSVASLNSITMKNLHLVRSDFISIVGKCRRTTYGIVVVDETLDEGKIRLNKVARKNLRVRLGGKSFN